MNHVLHPIGNAQVAGFCPSLRCHLYVANPYQLLGCRQDFDETLHDVVATNQYARFACGEWLAVLIGNDDPISGIARPAVFAMISGSSVAHIVSDTRRFGGPYPVTMVLNVISERIR